MLFPALPSDFHSINIKAFHVVHNYARYTNPYRSVGKAPFFFAVYFAVVAKGKITEQFFFVVIVEWKNWRKANNQPRKFCTLMLIVNMLNIQCLRCYGKCVKNSLQMFTSFCFSKLETSISMCSTQNNLVIASGFSWDLFCLWKRVEILTQNLSLMEMDVLASDIGHIAIGTLLLYSQM